MDPAMKTTALKSVLLLILLFQYGDAMVCPRISIYSIILYNAYA